MRSPSNVTLAVTKTDGSATYTPGGTATYTVTVTNTGRVGCGQRDGHRSAAGGRHAGGERDVRRQRHVELRHGRPARSGQTSFGTTGARVNAGGANALVFTAQCRVRRRDDDQSARQHRDRHRRRERGYGERLRQRHAGRGVRDLGQQDRRQRDLRRRAAGATYTIVVTNAGPSNAGSITVTDPLPAGVTLSAAATLCARPGRRPAARSPAPSGRRASARPVRRSPRAPAIGSRSRFP